MNVLNDPNKHSFATTLLGTTKANLDSKSTGTKNALTEALKVDKKIKIIML